MQIFFWVPKLRPACRSHVAQLGHLFGKTNVYAAAAYLAWQRIPPGPTVHMCGMYTVFSVSPSSVS